MTAGGDVDQGDRARVLLGDLQRRGLWLATAESLTGGLLSAAIVAIPGASRAFRGGVVAYATELKAQLLGVDADLLAGRGPVDAEVAAQMARGVRHLLGADIGLSTTGVAGPEAQGDALPGTVFIGVDARVGGQDSHAVSRLALAGDRSEIRAQTVLAALELARNVVPRNG